MVSAGGMFTFYETISIGLWFAVVGYKFLMFGYFLLIRYRKSKRIYWLYFALFFIFLAISRVMYIVHDYFISPDDTTDLTIMWKYANSTAWIAVAAASGILSTLLFTGESKFHMIVKIIFPIVPLVVAAFVVFIPASWVNEKTIIFPVLSYTVSLTIVQFYFDAIILLAYIVLLPFMFFYLAKKSVGTLARSFFLNGIGFLLYFAVRAVQAFIVTIWSPLLILLSILIIAFANQYEHLK
ncbi:MAG TPA: hypothetical protein VKM55_27755 [Candidatus Lokiarchaeia archaeon]|nr:hypothetical protein [Candidatus Lokiarchaeia archaeon]